MSRPTADEAHFFRDLIPAAGVNSEVALNVGRAGDLILRVVAANLRRFGLSEAQFGVLVILENMPEGLTQAEVARRSLTSRAGVTGLVRGMLARGWVRRAPMEGDGRAMRLQATQAGLDQLSMVLPSHLEHMRAMVGDCFNADEKAQLIDLLTRFRQHVAALNPPLKAS